MIAGETIIDDLEAKLEDDKVEREFPLKRIKCYITLYSQRKDGGNAATSPEHGGALSPSLQTSFIVIASLNRAGAFSPL